MAKKAKTVQVIYEDEELRVIYSDYGSDEIILVFPEAKFVADGNKIWGEALLDKLKLSSICFAPKHPERWFVQKNMVNTIKLVNNITKQYQSIIGYGYSMGGYGSIKYSGVFKMNCVISYAPQYAISPQDAPWDKGRHQFYNQNLHNMAIKKADLSPS